MGESDGASLVGSNVGGGDGELLGDVDGVDDEGDLDGEREGERVGFDVVGDDDGAPEGLPVGLRVGENVGAHVPGRAQHNFPGSHTDKFGVQFTGLSGLQQIPSVPQSEQGWFAAHLVELYPQSSPSLIVPSGSGRFTHSPLTYMQLPKFRGSSHVLCVHDESQ